MRPSEELPNLAGSPRTLVKPDKNHHCGFDFTVYPSIG